MGVLYGLYKTRLALDHFTGSHAKSVSLSRLNSANEKNDAGLGFSTGLTDNNIIKGRECQVFSFFANLDEGII